jgi:hypothetical protein
MLDARQIADRVQIARSRNVARDRDYMKVIAIRKGDYETVAPGLFNTTEFDKPLVANLIDTTARDIAEVMAPLPAFNCQSASLSSEADQKRQDLRGAIANCYVQNSRLQDQMFGGTDRYGSFGALVYIVVPDFDDQMPTIRVGTVPTANYTQDYRGRVKTYFEVFKAPVEDIRHRFPDAANLLKQQFGIYAPDQWVEVACWYDTEQSSMVLLDPCVVLTSAKNRLSRTPVRIVERPQVTDEGPRGQFDDVIWVQVARALIQMYTMAAIERSVNAPLVIPDDVNEIELGPFAGIQTKNPQGVQTVSLNIPNGLFPESQILSQEQRTGSRYPEGRSGSVDASIITGQGVQALMGTFDTQVQTFQRLNASALEDVIAMCYEMDEAYWPSTKKTVRIKDNGAPRKVEYTPSKDINGDHTIDVSYGAIAGLDPNRGLVFVLQALAGNLISKQTAMKSLPVDMNPLAETRQIELEQIDASVAATLAMIPQSIPQMAAQGADPRDIALQIAQVHKLMSKGKSPVDALEEVFAPKQTQPAPDEAEPPGQPAVDQAMQSGDSSGLPQGAASSMLMSLAGLSPGGKANLQSNVSRMTPTA